MFGFKFFVFVIFVSAFSFSQERKTISNNDPKYSVSKEQAQKILARLKKEGDSDLKKKRPSSNSSTEKREDAIPFLEKSCWADEDQFQTIQNQIIYPWIKSWRAKDSNSFEGLLAKNGKVDKFAVDFKSTPKKIGNIDFFENWHETTGKSDIKSYLSQFQKVDDVDLVVLKYTSLPSLRDKNLSMTRAELQIQFDFRGITTAGARRNDRGPLKVTVVRKNDNWKIQEISNWGVETLVSTKPTFSDITATSGVQAVPEYQRLEAIRRGGYAIALGDIDNDNITDLYLGAFGAGTLLLGKGEGKFVELKDSGLENDTLVKSAVFADFNNDGLPDILLTRFVPSKIGNDNVNYNTDILLYENLGNRKFKKVTSLIATRTPSETAMPAAVGDFNNDGKLDFYVGFPGSRDFTIFGKIPEKPGVRAQGLYMNLGNFKFSENNLESVDKLIATKEEYGRIFPHSAMAFDFDQDGDTDIVVIDDRGQVSPAYQNVGDGTFVQAQENIGLVTAGFGMGIAAADIDNNGILDLAVTNVNFNGKFRMDTSCMQNWKYQIFNTQDHGLKLFYGLKKGQFADASMKNGLTYGGEGLAGLEFLDYNNDGYQDLYVMNGLWSGTDQEQDLGPIYMRSSHVNEHQTLLESRGDTQSSVMKVLAGFIGDIAGVKKIKSRPHLAGFQRNRLFRNKGDGTFIEVGYLENVDVIADGYVMAKGDINNDGQQDIVLRNADPGSADVNFPAVQVLKNVSQEGSRSIRLKLVSGVSGSDAIGASVVLTAGNTTQYQQLTANNGASQSETILHFGIGHEKQASKIVITWPNTKKTTTLLNIGPGLHVVRENSGLLTGNN